MSFDQLSVNSRGLSDCPLIYRNNKKNLPLSGIMIAVASTIAQVINEIVHPHFKVSALICPTLFSILHVYSHTHIT